MSEYTAEQLRKWAEDEYAEISKYREEFPPPEMEVVMQLRAHADALERLAAIDAAKGEDLSGIAEALVSAGRTLEHYEDPRLRPLSEENFAIYDAARRSIIVNEKLLESLAARLAERDADFAKLKGFAEGMAERLTLEYTEGPCVDQAIGAALPQEVYAYRAAYPKEE